MFQEVKNLAMLEKSPDLILMSNALWHIKFSPEAKNSGKVYEVMFQDFFKPVGFYTFFPL